MVELSQMQPKLPPYVGITGVTTTQQIEQINEIWRGLKFPGYNLMLGFLVSHKQLVDCDREHSKRYLSVDTIFASPDDEIDEPHWSELILAAGYSFNVLHYNTKNPEFANEIDELVGLANDDPNDIGFGIYGIQLNIRAPDPQQIEVLRDRATRAAATLPFLKIVLQINPDTYEMINRYYKQGKDLDYLAGCEYYLIDASGGRGKPMDPEQVHTIAHQLADYHFYNRKGVAGGITPENVGAVITEFPFWSIDAESGLRNDQDDLDLEKVRQYLTNASAAIVDIENAVHPKEAN